MTSTQPNITTPSTAPITIAVNDVFKFFGPTRALNGVTFSAREGEIHAIVGGNGCGKSTLAKIVSGVLPITKGQISILGETPSTPGESRALGISTVYQEVLVADESTVVDNLFMGTDGLFSAQVSFDDKVARAAKMMRELAGEAVDPFALVGTLPLGIKQWITIGRGLLQVPRILILDESSAALDFDSTERLFDKMRELRDGGTTVLVVTHRIAELIRISDRATVLRDGCDVGVLEKEQITEKNLLALMTGDEQDADHAASNAPQPETKEVILRANNIKVWPDSNPIDFELLKGEIVGIAGLDGQGQDEFVRILSGVQQAAEGLVYVADKSGGLTPIQSLSDAVASKVSYVSGDRKREGIFHVLSIFENMVMPLYREKKRGGKLGFIDWGGLRTIFTRETENLLIKFGLAEDKITSLSGGNQQKVVVGRWLAAEPTILLMDEPTRGVDVGAREELYLLLERLASEGLAVLFASSDMEELLRLSDRVVVLHDGQITGTLDRSVATEEAVMELATGGGSRVEGATT